MVFQTPLAHTLLAQTLLAQTLQEQIPLAQTPLAHTVKILSADPYGGGSGMLEKNTGS